MSTPKTKRQPATVATAKARCHSDRRLVKQHVELLREILEHQIANLDNPHGHEFYKCYTYNTGEMPAWVKKAKRLVLLNDPSPPDQKVSENPNVFDDLDAKPANAMTHIFDSSLLWDGTKGGLVPGGATMPNEKAHRSSTEEDGGRKGNS